MCRYPQIRFLVHSQGGLPLGLAFEPQAWPRAGVHHQLGLALAPTLVGFVHWHPKPPALTQSPHPVHSNPHLLGSSWWGGPQCHCRHCHCTGQGSNRLLGCQLGPWLVHQPEHLWVRLWVHWLGVGDPLPGTIPPTWWANWCCVALHCSGTTWAPPSQSTAQTVSHSWGWFWI